MLLKNMLIFISTVSVPTQHSGYFLSESEFEFGFAFVLLCYMFCPVAKRVTVFTLYSYSSGNTVIYIDIIPHSCPAA